VIVSRSHCQLKTATKSPRKYGGLADFVVLFNSIVSSNLLSCCHVGLADFVVLWWGAYGGLAFDLQNFAKRIISLCCSASGCERNWSVFGHVSSYYLASLIG
jgi:hypothetical protein